MPKKQEEALPDVAPETVKWSPAHYRVKAADKVANGSGFASPYFSTEADAREWATILRQAFPGRYSLVRIEASREAMLPE